MTTKQFISKMAYLFLLIPLSVSAQSKATSPPKTSGFFYYQGKTTKKIALFKSKIEGAVAYSKKIRWVPLSLSLPPVNMDKIDNALALIKEGKNLGKEGNLQEGFDKFSKALDIFNKNIYTMATIMKKGKKKYRGLLKKLAIFSFYLEDKNSAAMYMAKYFTFRSKDKAEKWPEDLRPLWHKIFDPWKAKGKGHLEITTDPPDSRIYYKFKDKGVAPLIKSSPSGDILLLVTHPGYKSKTKIINLDVTKGAKVHITLSPMLKSPLKYILPAKLELGHNNTGENITKAAHIIGADVMLFFYMKATSSKDVKLTAFLFDTRIKRKLKEISKNFDPTSASDAAIRHFVNSIFANVNLSGVIKKPKPKSHFFKDLLGGISSLPDKKLFWPVVGGIGGAILIGTATAIILLNQDSAGAPPRGARTILMH